MLESKTSKKTQPQQVISTLKYGCFHVHCTYSENEALCKGIVGSHSHNTMHTEGCAWNVLRKVLTWK